MLESLRQIPWNQLQHAQGDATDLPTWLRLLASPIKEDREYAFYRLYDTIWHEGNIYEATAFAAPFLLELLQEETIRDKHELLLLLAHIQSGCAELENTQDNPFAHIDEAFPEFQIQLQEQQKWVTSAQSAVYAGLPTYISLLQHPERNVRIAAAYTLAQFPQAYMRIRPTLRQQLLHEQDNQVRASLLLCLRDLVGNHPEGMQSYLLHLQHKSTLVRWAAATSLAQYSQDNPNESVLQILLHTMVHSDSIAQAYIELPWAQGDIIGDTSLLLCRLGSHIAEQAIPKLQEVLEVVDPYSALNVAYALLYFTFGEPNESQALPPINEHQHTILTTLANTKNVWTINGNMFEILESFGLPGWKNELLAFLRQPNPSVVALPSAAAHPVQQEADHCSDHVFPYLIVNRCA